MSMPRYRAFVVLLGLSVAPGGILAQAPGAAASSSEQPSDPRLLGSIRGTVVDPTGTAVVGARVGLARGDEPPNQEVLSDDDGQFSFANVGAGPFHLTIGSAGFATQTFSGILHSGEIYSVPRTTLAIATAVTEVRVVPSPTEMAEDEIKVEEKQRVLGVVPNYYVTYVPNALPLSPKQKFELAWKTMVDPVSFGLTAGIAGIQQADDDFSDYGQGAQGYGKRYGAAYADFVTSTLIGSAILPSLLKQDPRYFYKGTGSKRSRIFYALANSVICKGDNGHWQANYSGIVGSLAAGGISNLYYPAKDRGSVELTFENALIGIGASAATNLLQEFVIRKLTPSASGHGRSKVQSTVSMVATALVHAGN
jgi:Carboxypeptidase regulatory-like domain